MRALNCLRLRFLKACKTRIGVEIKVGAWREEPCTTEVARCLRLDQCWCERARLWQVQGSLGTAPGVARAMDLSSFSSPDFDPKRFINDACANRAGDEPIERCGIAAVHCLPNSTAGDQGARFGSPAGSLRSWR